MRDYWAERNQIWNNVFQAWNILARLVGTVKILPQLSWNTFQFGQKLLLDTEFKEVSDSFHFNFMKTKFYSLLLLNILALSLSLAPSVVVGEATSFNGASLNGVSLNGISLNGASQLEPPSIYTISPETDGLIIGSTGLLTIAAYAFQFGIINRRCPCDPNEINSFDRFAVYNQSPAADIAAGVSVGASLIAPIAIDYLDIGFSRAFKEDMVVYAETMTVSWFMVNAVKFTTQRPLPKLYASQTQGGPEDYLAFYSGHTTTAVTAMAAMSMTYTYRHGFSIWPWLATGVLGASVGVEMVAAAEHFPTDVIVGFITGAGIGWAVPYLHAKKSKVDGAGGSGEVDGLGQGFTVVPVESGTMAMWYRHF